MVSNLRIVEAIKKLKEYQEQLNQRHIELLKKQEETDDLFTTNDKNNKKLLKELNKEINIVENSIEELEKKLNNKLNNIRLTPGKNGIDGKNGKDGLDGKDGINGRDGINGKDGLDGKNGKDGKDGKDGVGILDIEINKKGELVITLTNKKIINAGRVRGLTGIGIAGSNGKDGVSVTKAEIKNSHLIITLSDETEIDAGYISGGGGGVSSYNDLNDKPTLNNITIEGNMALEDLGIQPEGDYALSSDIPTALSQLDNDTSFIDTETDPVFSASASAGITSTDITNWNNKSDFSGDYNDLTNKPTIPVIPTNISAFNNDVGYLTEHQDISGKYDKTGGEITGNVKIDGNLTLNIEDEDYDSGITFTKELNDNLGTTLTLTGYANANGDNTNYRPIIRNIGTPNSSYDVANKKYVDDNVVVPTYHLVFLNADGTIDTYGSTVNYTNIKNNLTNPKEADYLDIVWGSTRFYAKCIEVTDVNSGDLKFIGEVEYQGLQRYMVFTLNSNSVLTTTNIITFESISNKSQSILTDTGNTDKYTSVKAVEDFVKPVVIWESNTSSEYLKGIQANLSASPSWQLTDLDMTQFKRIKIYSCAGQKSGTTASASTTPAIVLEMSLDSRNAISAYGGNYVGSIVVQKPNDANRLATLTCAVSSDKTKFVVLRQSNLYGTAVTGNDDVNANVFLIEGYYY